MDFFDFIKNNKLIILIISIILNVILLSLSIYLLWNNLNYECPTIENDNSITLSKEDSIETFYVDVKGAVKNPGVYEVNNDNIINDIITLAGGFAKKAYTKNINLSKKVTNELVIYVYTESEYKKLNTDTVEVVVEECICPSYDISDCTNNAVSEIKPDNNTENDNIISENNSNDNVDSTSTEDNKLININTASLDELMTLSGIGESKAKAIIEYRTTNKFNSIEDIKNVSGIGDSAFEKIKDNITI